MARLFGCVWHSQIAVDTECTIAERNGGTVNIFTDSDGIGDRSDRAIRYLGIVQLISTFSGNNIDADDLTSGNDDVPIFVKNSSQKLKEYE